jgi:hypothetical protein
MLKRLRSLACWALLLSLYLGAIPAWAQLGNSGSIEGVVKDASGGVIAGAKVEIANPVSGFSREVLTGAGGDRFVLRRTGRPANLRNANFAVEHRPYELWNQSHGNRGHAGQHPGCRHGE